MARRHIREVDPHTDGPIQVWLDEHDTALDALEGGTGTLPADTAPADVNTAAAIGTASQYAREDHVHALANLVVAEGKLANNSVADTKLRDSGALSIIGRSANSAGDPADIAAVAASGAVLREASNVLGFGTLAAGAFADGTISESRLTTNAVIERQTLGADAQDLTIAVNGAADERVIVEGYGDSPGGGTCSIQINGNATGKSTMYSQNGGAPGASTSWNFAGVAGDPLGFFAVFDLRTGQERGGFVVTWIRAGATTDIYVSAFRWDDTSTAVTALKFAGSTATFFGSGFKVVTRRRKMAA